MNKYVLIMISFIIPIVALTLGNFPQSEKVVATPHIIIKEKIVEVIKEVEEPIEVITEKPVYIFSEQEVVKYVGANATGEELARADKIIAYGIYAHQFYVDHPEFQTARTGDAILNQTWVDNYIFLKELLDRAYKGAGQ